MNTAPTGQICMNTKLLFIGGKLLWNTHENVFGIKRLKDNPSLKDDIIIIDEKEIIEEGILESKIEAELSKMGYYTQVIIFLQIHGCKSDDKLTFDKKLLIEPTEVSNPIMKYRNLGMNVYGILQSCYTGNNKILTNCFNMSVGSTEIVMVNPFNAEKMAIDFLAEYKNQQIDSPFENVFAVKYLQEHNNGSDAWGTVDIREKGDEPPWKLYKGVSTSAINQSGNLQKEAFKKFQDGDFDNAMKILQIAKKVMEEHKETNNICYNGLLINMAKIKNSEELLDEALDLLMIVKEKIGTDNEDYSQMVIAIVDVYMKKGMLDESLQILNEVKSTLDKKHRDYIQILIYMVNIHLEKDQKNEASIIYTEAYNLGYRQ